MKTFFSLLITALFIFATQISYAASFDCAKATSKVEKMICSDPDLSQLDDTLTLQYQKKLISSKNMSILKRDQQRWLSHVRNTCSTTDCLNLVYEQRIKDLQNICDFFNQLSEQDINEARKMFTESYLGEICNPENIVCRKPNVSIEALQARGLSINDKKFKSIINSGWGMKANALDVNNDGLEDLQIYSVVGTAHCKKSYFFIKQRNGQLKSALDKKYDTFATEGNFCGSSDLIFFKHEKLIYILEIYDKVHAVWLDSGQGLESICKFY